MAASKKKYEETFEDEDDFFILAVKPEDTFWKPPTEGVPSITCTNEVVAKDFVMQDEKTSLSSIRKVQTWLVVTVAAQMVLIAALAFKVL